jgi:hypothetical protein
MNYWLLRHENIESWFEKLNRVSYPKMLKCPMTKIKANKTAVELTLFAQNVQILYF